jgi:ribonuclease BN (tRNA processing enzyme)
VAELPVGASSDFLGHSVTTAEVSHFSGAASTAVRISDGKKVFAYSGDTEWVDTLCLIAKEADLFILECYAQAGPAGGHMTWTILKEQLGKLHARRIMLTHMNPSMLARLDEVRAHGLLAAADGAVLEL